MSEELPAPSVVAGWTTRVWFAAISITLAFILIGYLVLQGNPVNALHQSALSWAFMVVLGILGGFGLGAVADLAPWKK